MAKTAELMELVLPKPLPSWEDFSSVALCPLRVQMMGSVVVSIHIFRVVQLNEMKVNLVSQHAACMYVSNAIQACKLALNKGWAINIGGGFSHYTTNTGGGLAVYDDVSVCLAVSFLLFLL